MAKISSNRIAINLGEKRIADASIENREYVERGALYKPFAPSSRILCNVTLGYPHRLAVAFYEVRGVGFHTDTQG